MKAALSSSFVATLNQSLASRTLFMILIASSVVFVSLTGILELPFVRASKIAKYSLVGLHPTSPITGLPTGLAARDGYVYFSYQNATAGIGRLDPSTKTVKLYPLPGNAGYTVVSLEVGEAYAWIITEDVGETLYAVNLMNGRITNWPVGKYTNGLLVENDSSIWLTGPSLDHLNPNTGQMKSYPLPCIANRCFTNSTLIYRPIWANGKIWALLTHAIPAPNYPAGEALIEIDPQKGNMTLYAMPKFYRNGQWLLQGIYDVASDNHGNLWLPLDFELAEFHIATNTLESVQSIFGNGAAPAVCDREGDLFFVQQPSLSEYSPSSHSFTEYWTADHIQDLVVDSNDTVWFLNTYVNEASVSVMDLYSLSVGGPGTTITTAASFNSTVTLLSAIPSNSLTYTSSLASTTATPVSTVVMTQSTSTLMEASTITATQTFAVDELETPAAVITVALILVTMWVTLGRRARRRHWRFSISNHRRQ